MAKINNYILVCGGTGCRASRSEEIIAALRRALDRTGESERTRVIRTTLLRSMKKTALFVNAARSAIVDYTALEKVLREEAIAGAIIDVLDTEPPTEADLAIGKCPNVLLTPHICGATYEVTDHQSRILNERIKKWLRGEDMEKIVYNRDVVKK